LPIIALSRKEYAAATVVTVNFEKSLNLSIVYLSTYSVYELFFLSATVLAA
jgi:hypothetical protein